MWQLKLCAECGSPCGTIKSPAVRNPGAREVQHRKMQPFPSFTALAAPKRRANLEIAYAAAKPVARHVKPEHTCCTAHIAFISDHKGLAAWVSTMARRVHLGSKLAACSSTKPARWALQQVPAKPPAHGKLPAAVLQRPEQLPSVRYVAYANRRARALRQATWRWASIPQTPPNTACRSAGNLLNSILIARCFWSRQGILTV